MAVVTRKSDVVTQVSTKPVIVPLTPDMSMGRVRSSLGVLTSVGADSATSVYQLVRLPSDSRMDSASFVDFASAVDIPEYDVGVRHTSLASTATGYQSVDCFINGPAKAAGAASAVLLIAVGDAATKRQKKLWELAGAATDPGGFYDVIMTINTAPVAVGGEINMDAKYVLD